MNIEDIVNVLLSSPEKKLLFLYIYQNKTDEAISIIKENTNCNDNDIDQIIKLFYQKYNTEAHNSSNNAIAQEWQNKPKCPTCNSTNLKKVSTTSKVVNTAVFGLFGTKRYKTFHCNNCGYEW